MTKADSTRSFSITCDNPLSDDALDKIAGGRCDNYGDHIGNYNFRLEIDGVDAGQFQPTGFKPPIGSDKGS